MDNIVTVTLNPKSIDNLVKKLAVTTGIRFEYYQKQFLEKRIKFRMNNLNLSSCKSYLEYINKHPEEIDLFQENFTINHTFFFRNYEIFEKVGKLVKDFTMGLKNPIKIWSCPCASGEEPYSIAMFFDQLKKKKPNFPDYEIIASDIDKRAIELARRGIYQDSIIKEVPNIYKASYFKKKKENNRFIYIINENIKDKVEFIIEDLTNGHEKPHKYDIIFCRNFLIYINENSRKKVSQILKNHLKDRGLLILGKVETLSEGHSNFKSYDHKNNFYVKKDFDLKERSEVEIEQRKKSPSKKIKKPEKKGKLYKKTIKPIKKITSRPKQVKSQKKKFSPSKTQKEQIKAELKPLKTYIKGPSKQVKPSKIQSRPSEIIEKLRFKDVEEHFKKIEQRFKQIELLEKQTDLLEKQVNRRLEQVELLKNQIVMREKELEEPEKQIEHREMLLEQREKHIKQRENRAEQHVKQLAKLEREVEQRIKQLEQLEKQVEKRVEERVKYLEQLEKQVKKRIEHQTKLQAEPLEKKVKKRVKQDIKLTDQIKEGDLIQVTNPNLRGELVIPEGYYALINYNDEKLTSYKFSIFRLGSGIALILNDNINKIYTMSHCILPNSAEPDQIEKLYKSIKISVTELLSLLLSNGASKENIKAIILGGAKIFNEDSSSIQKNIKMFKRELNSLEIQIEKEDVGGLSERTIIYNTKNNSLLVKKT